MLALCHPLFELEHVLFDMIWKKVLCINNQPRSYSVNLVLRIETTRTVMGWFWKKQTDNLFCYSSSSQDGTVICHHMHTTMFQLVLWVGGRGGDLCDGLPSYPRVINIFSLPVVSVSCDFTLHTEYVCMILMTGPQYGGLYRI